MVWKGFKLTTRSSNYFLPEVPAIIMAWYHYFDFAFANPINHFLCFVPKSHSTMQIPVWILATDSTLTQTNYPISGIYIYIDLLIYLCIYLFKDLYKCTHIVIYIYIYIRIVIDFSRKPAVYIYLLVFIWAWALPALLDSWRGTASVCKKTLTNYARIHHTSKQEKHHWTCHDICKYVNMWTCE